MKNPTHASLPRIAIIGRMNVGKSTLFNRFTESRQAIVSSWPGTTRDVTEGIVLWRGKEWLMYDSGGLDVTPSSSMEQRIVAASEHLIHIAQVLLFVVDGKAGLTPHDKLLLRKIRNAKKPFFLLVNKIDNDQKEREILERHAALQHTGAAHVFFCSARNGRGSGEILDAVNDHFHGRSSFARTEINEIRVAIVGRPNVGKSTLLNSILGEERAVVDAEPHTTRDSNDIVYVHRGTTLRLMDTAGIRKRPRVGLRWPDARLGSIERESVQQSLRAIEHADVVMLVVEAHHRVMSQDKQLAHIIEEQQKGLLVVINKWDRIDEQEPQTIRQFRNYFDAALPFLRWAPMIFVSASAGTRVHTALDMVVQIAENRKRRVPADALQRMVELLNTHAGVHGKSQPRMRKARKPLLSFRGLTQEIGSRFPTVPTFYLAVNRPKDVPAALVNICEREIREACDFAGTQIKIIIGK